VVLWLEKPVQMNDEISHVSIIDRLLRLLLPSRSGGFEIGEDSHNIEVIEISKRHTVEISQFTAKNQMQQLCAFFVARHAFFPVF
jgi:hypothetical protein